MSMCDEKGSENGKRPSISGKVAYLFDVELRWKAERTPRNKARGFNRRGRKRMLDRVAIKQMRSRETKRHQEKRKEGRQ